MKLTRGRLEQDDVARRGSDRRGTEFPSTARLLAVFCLLAAGVIHVAQVPTHFREWGPAGLTFVVLAILQGLFAGLVLARPSPKVVSGAALVSAGTVLLWLESRTIGIPFGPDAWARERVGRPDSVATALEVVTLLALLLMLRGHRKQVGSVRAYATVGLIGALVASATWIGVQPVAGCGAHGGASLTGPLVPLDGHSIVGRSTPIAEANVGEAVGLVVGLLKNCAGEEIHLRSAGLITSTNFGGAVSPVSFWVLPPGTAVPGRPVSLPELLARGERLPGNARVETFRRSEPMPTLVLLVRTLKAGAYTVDGLEIRYFSGGHAYQGIYADVARLRVRDV